MSTIDKKVEKFLKNPKSCKYTDIKRILIYFGFVVIPVKRSSHIKFKHAQLKADLIIPVHNNECKDHYKLEARKKIKELQK